MNNEFRVAGLGGTAAAPARLEPIADKAGRTATPPAVPKAVDVAIVGGGVVGLFTALVLARRGVQVAVFEKGLLGGEQSTRNWGWCRQFGRDARELPLAERAMRLWREPQWRSDGATPFRQCGIVYIAQTEDQAQRYAAYTEHHGLPSGIARSLTRREVEDLLPGYAAGRPALYLPNDGRADPDLAVAELAAAAGRAGAAIFENCAALGFETSAGRASALVTEFGRVDCNAVVVAAGAWSSLFCRPHGLTVPQIKIVSSALVTEPIAGPAPCVFGDGFAIGRQRDGGYLVGHGGAAVLPLGPDLLRYARQIHRSVGREWTFVRSYIRARLDRLAVADWRDALPAGFEATSPYQRRRTLDPPAEPAILDDALLRLGKAFPAFAQARVRKRWAGVIDVTPDALPVISPVPAIPGLVVGTGFSGHGFGLSPATGEVLADLATGRQPDIDVTPFRLSRFSDGSRPLPGVRF